MNEPGPGNIFRNKPQLWFGNNGIDGRDQALINAQPVDFAEFGEMSYIRMITHMKRGQDFNHTRWTLENDRVCRNMIRTAGATLVGFPPAPLLPNDYVSMTINVAIKGSPSSGFTSGFLMTQPRYIRVFKGIHDWDVMVLRDCIPNTSSLYEIPKIASRKWDILAMKKNDDIVLRWEVLSINDAGLATDRE